MLRPRITPCLLIQDSGLVKTVKFKEPKYVGDPINAVRIFNEKEADELIILDIDASVKGQSPNFKQIEYIAAQCRMPLCYGGGVKNALDAKRITSLGVEKIAISSAAIETPNLIREISNEVGKQSLVVVIDAKKRLIGSRYDVWIENGTKNTKLNVLDWAIKVEKLGAGEIVINSIDRDGCMQGYDLALLKKIRDVVTIPITILGGAGSLDDLGRAVSECGVIGVAAGSLFVFKGPYKAVLINYPEEELKIQNVYEIISKEYEIK